MPPESTSFPPGAGMAATHPPLRRTRDDRIVAGVCGGLARTLGVPVLAVRLLALVVAAAVTPLLLIAYAGLAVAMPRDDGRALLGGQPEDRRETVIGIALIGIALIALASGIGSTMLGHPGGLVLLAIAVVLVVVHHQRRGAGPGGGETAPAAPPAPPVHRSAVASPYPGPPASVASAAGGTTRTMPLPYPAAPPTRPAAPREPSVALYGLGAVIGASMIALVVAALGGFDASAEGVAVGLGLGALALTVAAIVFARRRGALVLIALAGLLAVGAGGTAAVGGRVDEGVGERVQDVSTPAALAAEHRLGIGHLVVDVAPGALSPGLSTVRARLGIGELVVRVPAGVRVESVGPTSPQGMSEVNDAAGVSPERTLRIDADVDIGDLRVETTYR